MKRILAILALVSIVLVLPAAASTRENIRDAELASTEVQGIYVPPVTDHGGGQEEADQQDNNGDPDDLGGGFRNHGAPPTGTGADGIIPWFPPLVYALIMQLI